MHVKNQDGKILSISIISGGIPEGFELVTIPDELASEELRFLEAVEVPAIDAIEGSPEKWTKDGEEDLLSDPEDDTWTHVPAVDAVAAVPAHLLVQKKSTADTERRNEILDKLRLLRKPLLDEADIEINKLFDTDTDASAWKTYRQSLRDVTATYIKVDGDPKVSVDTIDLDNFIWPSKP